MPRRAVKKTAQVDNAIDPAFTLRKALSKRTKTELVDVLMELAEEDRGIVRRLAARFELQAPPQELAALTRQAIADATDFDPRDINRNFDYDYKAYEAVKRNFTHLVEQGQLQLAMELSLELMREGSRQVEMSDEGLMTEDIQACLQVVIQSLSKCDLPASKLHAWCTEMLHSDRVGFICDRELRALQDRLATSQA